MRYLYMTLSAALAMTVFGCAKLPKQVPEKEKPLFVILPSENEDVKVSDNFPERLSKAIKSSKAGRVIQMPTVKSLNMKEHLIEASALLERLETSGFKRVYLVGFKKGSVVGCRLLNDYPFLRGYVGIDMVNEYPGGGCLSHLRKRGPVRVLDIYTQRAEGPFRDSNLRSQFLYKNYDQEMAFGTGGDFSQGEYRVFKSIQKWMR